MVDIIKSRIANAQDAICLVVTDEREPVEVRHALVPIFAKLIEIDQDLTNIKGEA